MNDWAEFRHFKYLLVVAEHKDSGPRRNTFILPNRTSAHEQFQDFSDVHLFRKGKDGRIRLTAAGLAFKSIAQGLLDARDEAIAALIAIEREEIRALKFGWASFVDRALFHEACKIHKELVSGCPVRATHGDTVQLVEEIVSSEIDVAIRWRVDADALPARPHFWTAAGAWGGRATISRGRRYLPEDCLVDDFYERSDPGFALWETGEEGWHESENCGDHGGVRSFDSDSGRVFGTADASPSLTRERNDTEVA